MTRLCMRPGCDRDAAARLTYDLVACQVWLDDLAERTGRSQEVCSLHAERLTAPRGWLVSDRRSADLPMFPTTDLAPEDLVPEDPAPDVAPATELFDVLRRELAEQAAAPAPEPEPAPAPEPEPEPEPAPAPEPEPEPEPDETPAALRATSPLLARAFASTGHQRSVLTQPGPTAPDESAAPG